MNFTIWISGISASGKTTLGSMLYYKLKELGFNNVIFFDGDELRKRLPKSYGHGLDDRYKILNQYIKIINKEMAAGKIVIVSTISHKKDMRALARGKIKNFFEVSLYCSPNICAKRDFKNQYKKAINGKFNCFPGITEPYEFTDNSDLTIDTHKNDINKSFSILFKGIKNHFKIK
tara:strand:+ start:174 stop:698 length:525 start_codon:yes stop_codon:yes gene_type:complete